jgi:glyoxylase-like metal-dependent hydrolase (beta-lactamase superfamily II)
MQCLVAFELLGEVQMSDRKRVRRLGNIRVTALEDGYDDLPMTVVVNIDEAGAKALAELSSDRLLHPVFNAYLIETDGRRLLIDAGAGVHMGPNAGKMLKNLAESGVAPGDVNAIVLTHCHPDHILGTVDKDWNAVFSNAELVVPKLDEQFWLSSNPSKMDNEYQRVEAERARKAAAAYSGRTRIISGGEVAPGITMVPLPGHTPGHSGYMIDGGGKKLFLWGDIVHLPTFQPAQPDANLIFDVDLPLTRETRKQTFERVIADELEIGGGHLLDPGFARVERAGAAYRIVPSV